MSGVLRYLRFGLIERYILRTAGIAFLSCLLVLTAVIWVTQALKDLDLLTGQGQTIITFLSITGLTVPALITIIAPVALFIACIFTLNKLNGDSELIVMSAAGTPPATLLKPFIILALAVSALTGALTLYIMPESFRRIRVLFTKVQADLVTNIVKEGQFAILPAGVLFHYRDKTGPTLNGVFMQDRREKDRVTVYIAERGQTVEANGSSYLVLEKGSVQRISTGQEDASIVVFDRYAIDLREMSSAIEASFWKPQEQTTWGLIIGEPKPPNVAFERRFRAELHDRFSAPLYPLAFMLIAFAALGAAQTTRQGRGKAIGVAVLAVAGLRGLGFLASTVVGRSSIAAPLVYLLPIAGGAAALFAARQSTALRNWRTMLPMALARPLAPRPAAARA